MRNSKPPWSREDDAELMATYKVKSNLDLAIYFDRSEKAIAARASALGLTDRAFREADDGSIAAAERNHAFIVAMARAIRAGLEHPPMIGVDKRPCTKAPMVAA